MFLEDGIIGYAVLIALPKVVSLQERMWYYITTTVYRIYIPYYYRGPYLVVNRTKYG